jgi:L-fuconolactonase
MKIDAHQHFWKYNPVEYGWIDDAMSVIRRDFLPADLRREISQAGVDGVVSVQARQILEETEWLLQVAAENDFIRGVVGWVPLRDPGVGKILKKLAARPKLCGVRHVVQAEADDRFILRDDFNRGIKLLRQFGLTYDILVYEWQLPPTIEFVDRHPDQVFVLDHVAKPRIRNNLLEPWRKNIRELARRENVYCKISGMVTEADYKHWTEDQLTPYVEAVLEAFGPRRLMFGSDWPVCLVACSYLRWREIVSVFTSRLSANDRAWIFGKTAIKAYSLERL